MDEKDVELEQQEEKQENVENKSQDNQEQKSEQLPVIHEMKLKNKKIIQRVG